jgi:hypothetical protein
MEHPIHIFWGDIDGLQLVLKNTEYGVQITGNMVFLATLLFYWDSSDFDHFTAFSRVFSRFIRNLSTYLESATKMLTKKIFLIKTKKCYLVQISWKIIFFIGRSNSPVKGLRTVLQKKISFWFSVWCHFEKRCKRFLINFNYFFDFSRSFFLKQEMSENFQVRSPRILWFHTLERLLGQFYFQNDVFKLQ